MQQNTYSETSSELGDRNYYIEQVVEYFWQFVFMSTDIDDALLLTSMIDSVAPNRVVSIDDSMVNTRLNEYVFRQKLKESPLFIVKNNESSLKETFDYISLVLIVTFFIFCIYSIFRLFTKRFLGFEIGTHFRQTSKAFSFEEYVKSDKLERYPYIQVIRPTSALIKKIEMELSAQNTNDSFELNLNNLSPLLSYVVDISTLDFNDELVSDWAGFILDKLFVEEGVEFQSNNKGTIFLKGLENVASRPKERGLALEFFEALLDTKNIRIVLLCELAPLYMLINREAYPVEGEVEKNVEPSEKLRWANVLRSFEKIYQWNASFSKTFSQNNTAMKALYSESTGWPELNDLVEQFCIFQRVKGRTLPSGDEFESFDHQQLVQINRNITFERFEESIELINKDWTPSQVVEFFSANASAFYRFRWELCTKDERLLLFQIAKGQEPNPRNRAPIEHLTRRGYIYRDHGWHIINESFAEFVLTAEPMDVMETWADEANESVWRYLRIPFFALIISLAAIMTYSATDAVESAVGILTAILGLIPMAVRSLSVIKGG